MLPLHRYLLALLLCWLLLFLLQQSCFLFFEPVWTKALDAQAIRASYLRALPMDLSAACYFTLPVLLLCIPLLWKEMRWARKAIKGILIALVIASAFINVCDIALFRAWGTKVNHKALSYLVYPEEVFITAAGVRPGQLVVVFLAQCAVAWFLFSRVDHKRAFTGRPVWQRMVVIALFPVLLLTGMRGGWQDFPIDRSWSYHSVHPVLNLGALNGAWNVIVLLAEPPEIAANPYTYMPPGEAEGIFQEMHADVGGARDSILTVPRPNILMVLLESWTADVVGVLDGDSAVTPGFDRLAKDGLLFTNFYSTGYRTEQGLCALLSSFPSQPKTTIIRQYGKFERLPSLVNVLDSAGYRSTYWYTGDVAFANTRAYLETMGFDAIHDENSDAFVKRTDWGAYDEELFAFHLRNTRQELEPFFHTVMTATSHEPFDAPVDGGFPGHTDPQMYCNTVCYTDRTLAAFIDSCRAMPWWDRTLVIIVADHGHYLPRYRGNYSAERHRIPFLLTGGALRPELRGSTNATFGCHVDLAASLLGQLNLPSERFTWSKDLFAPDVRHFAYWTFDDGFGIADARQTIVWDNLAKLVMQRRDTSATAEDDARLLRQGQALEQVLLERYLELSQ